jgi:hypothetical protein
VEEKFVEWGVVQGIALLGTEGSVNRREGTLLDLLGEEPGSECDDIIDNSSQPT